MAQPTPPSVPPGAPPSAPTPPAPSNAANAAGCVFDTGWKYLLRMIPLVVALIGIITAWVLAARRHMSEWATVKIVVFTIPFLVALLLVGLFYSVMRARGRIQRNWVKNNPDDPFCRNLLVVYDLSRKALYMPAIATSLAMCVITYLRNHHGFLASADPKAFGGIWLGVFFVNFLVEEYDVDLRGIVIATVLIAATFIWVAFMDWMTEFFRLFEKFGIEISPAGYLLIALVFSIGILYSMVKGAFHYVMITPNYINIQTGVAETGEQVSREQFSTCVVAEDLIERMLGFGRIIIMFRDTRRSPMTLLVHGIGKKATQLEAIRSTYLVDSQDATRGA